VPDSDKLIAALAEKYKDGKTNFIDGLSVDYPNWRFNIRASNTEPLLRLNVEALEEKLMEQKRDEIADFIKNHA